jgi:TRAP-type mannitol/chloroaromatic compound transport system substrate-binding protein
MQARYSPWWMPTAIVFFALVSLVFGALLVLKESSSGESSGENVQTSGKVYEWDLVTSWPKNFPGLGVAPENFARMVNELSNGRLIVHVHGANTIVPALGVFDAVSSGSVEMGHAAAYYWKGKIPSAPFFTSVPFGMNVLEYNSWITHGGGLELWREAYAPHNVIPFPGGNTGVQMGGWFNVEINDIEDIKGVKMRIPGLGGEVFTRAGGTAVTIPSVELYNAIQTGVIDALEWVGPYNDLSIGFHQVAKYYYYPGWHETGAALEFTVNKQAYESLPADLQSVIEVASLAANQLMIDEYMARSSAALDELKTKYKVDVRPFPEDVLGAFYGHAQDLYREQSEKDPLFKKVSEHYFEFKRKASNYSDISEEAYYRLP